MKILKIHLRNLNSLRGEWIIDLTDPQYTANGIFTITGPTGAGKSTILDAICLALYGRTPRLERVNNAGNEIMSRLSGDCFAEVTFQARGELYRCNWSQRRARNKPDGALQPQQRQLARVADNTIISGSVSEVSAEVEKITGMDFNRFTRAMMLAQGGFAAFLMANADERAPLLEQITGTEIYSLISKKVHERKTAELQALSTLRGQLQGITILGTDDEAAKQTELQGKQNDETTATARLAVANTALQWRHALNQLQNEITGLNADITAQQTVVAEFAPQRQSLQRAVRALALEGAYATLTAKRQTREADQNQLQREETAIPALTQKHTDTQTRLRAAETALEQSRNHLREATPQWNDMRERDSTITHRRRELEAAQQKQQKELADLEKHTHAKHTKEGELEQKKTELSAYITYQDEHRPDEWLVANLSGITARLGSLEQQRKQLDQARRQAQAAGKAEQEAARNLQQIQEACGQADLSLQQAGTALADAQNALQTSLGDSTLKEQRLSKEALLREIGLVRKILSYEDERRHLADGAPCPLCGATDHPYARGNVPPLDEYERKLAAIQHRIGEAEKLTEACADCEKRKTAAAGKLEQAQIKLQAAVQTHEQAVETAQRESAALQQTADQLNQQETELAQTLAPVGISDISGTKPQTLLNDLQTRLDNWNTNSANKAATEKAVETIANEIQQIAAAISVHRQTAESRRAEIGGMEDILREAQCARADTYGTRDPDIEERQTRAAIENHETGLNSARREFDAARDALNSAITLRDTLLRRIAAQQGELEIAQTEFAAQLSAHDFTDEADFAAARLSAAEREALQKQAQELQEKLQQLQTKLRDRQERYAATLTQNVTEKDIAELEALRDADTIAQKDARDAITLLAAQLAANNIAKQQIEGLRQNIELQQRECARWERLHELIGSADGKKYRNFAQGLTFEIMVGHANRQLQKLTDRYLLLRDAKQPLELNVIDNYQAGEIRSTKNLSGGESFIVSLALALGLSHMVSDKIRVDSLFLDEGFGTLDDEALDNALTTLAALQHEGKMIGVISHVAALKERIPTQIAVTPMAGGRSRLSGPGCTAIKQGET